MLRIITEDNREFDLLSEMNLEIEISNPIFEDQRMLAAFSTSIQLPPSATNREILDYFPESMMLPAVRKLAVSLYDGENALLAGELSFDSVGEDGNLEYLFSSKPGLNTLRTAYRLEDSLKSVTNSAKRYSAYPILVKESKTGYSEYSEADGTSSGIEPEEKYMNTVRDTEMFGCHRILNVLGEIGFNYDNDLVPVIGREVAVMAFDEEMTLAAFLENVCKLFCCVVSTETGKGGQSVTDGIKSIGEILAQTEFLDWSQKVSDVFSSTIEAGKGYKLSYSNTKKTAPYDKSTEARAYQSLSDGLDLLYRIRNETRAYLSIKILAPEVRYYSGKYHKVKVPGGSDTAAELLCDFLGCAEETPVDTSVNGEQLDASVDFILPECTVIEKVSNSLESKNRYFFAPIVEDASPKGVVIGNLFEGTFPVQLTDGTLVGSNSSNGFFQIGEDLSPNALYKRLHATFAEWLAKDRQVVDVDVDLSAEEICSFRIWQKVFFSNAFWMAKKLTVSIDAKNGVTGCRGEFIEF